MAGPSELPLLLPWVLRTFKRHKKKMALFCLAVMGVVAAFVVFGPRSYLSEAKLLVRLGRENATLDPTATLGQAPVVVVPNSREYDINSVIEVARSRVLLEKVVDTVGPERILDGMALPPDDPRRPAQRYRAVRQLDLGLRVEAVKKSNVITVTFEGASPELAQTVVGKLVDAFLDHHLHLNRTPGAPKFLAEQAERLRKELARSEQELKELKDHTGLIAPEGQQQQLVARIGKVEEDLAQTAAALAGAEAEAGLLRQKLAELPKTQVIAQTKGLPNQAADTMRGQLYALQLKELELLTKYSGQNPEVRLFRRQIAAARDILAREERTRSQEAVGPGKAYEAVQLALLKQEPLLAGLHARAKALRGQLDRERAALRTFNGAQLRLAKQQRVVDLQKSLLRRYSESVEQAQIDQALTQERITNIGIVQPATYELKPFRPRVGITLALGLAFALLGSIGLALATENLQPAAESEETPRPPESSVPAVPTNGGPGRMAFAGEAPRAGPHLSRDRMAGEGTAEQTGQAFIP